MLMLTDIQSPGTLPALAVVFAAAVIRGFSGFGFSLAAVPLLSVIMPLNGAIPLALALEAIGILPSLPRIWRLTRWQDLATLLSCSLAIMPAGLLLLHMAPGVLLRPAICAAMLLCIVLIWHTPAAPTIRNSLWKTAAAGALSGFLNGAAAMSGPPIILYFLSRPIAADASRATMMVFFSIGAALTMAFGIGAGVYALPTPGFLIVSVFPLLAGMETGTWCARRTSVQKRRQISLVALGFIAMTGILMTVAVSP